MKLHQIVIKSVQAGSSAKLAILRELRGQFPTMMHQEVVKAAFNQSCIAFHGLDLPKPLQHALVFKHHLHDTI